MPSRRIALTADQELRPFVEPDPEEARRAYNPSCRVVPRTPLRTFPDAAWRRWPDCSGTGYSRWTHDEVIGVLTGGGDCPGLNAAIRVVTRRSLDLGSEVVGIENGWKGLVEGTTQELTRQRISGILPRGGTIIGTARTNPYKLEGGVDKVTAQCDHARAGWAGGDRRRGHSRGRHAAVTRSTGFRSSARQRRSTTTSSATDYTIGFDTAVAIAPRRSIGCTRRPSPTTA